MDNKNDNELENDQALDNSSKEEKKKSFQNNIEIDDSECYINPYNFITLPERCERKSYKERQGNLTGVIECVLKAETPIMVPDTENVNIIDLNEGKKRGGKHTEYQFFNYKEQREEFTVPVIPGSEIRGMLRSDYETFTDSCMSTLSKDNFPTKDIKVKNKPGILEKDTDGNWILYKASKYVINTQKNIEANENKKKNKKFEGIRYTPSKKNEIKIDGKIIKTGDEVEFVANKGDGVFKIGKEEGKEIKKGIAFIGKTDNIFIKSEETVEVEELNEEVKTLESILEAFETFYQKSDIKNKYAGYDIKNRNILPVWYTEPVNKRTHLSLAEEPERELSELVKDFMPCVDREKICNCCNLFGFVSEESADSSKIRVSDAIYTANENPYDEKITIKELASPHMKNAAFYCLYAPETGFINMPQTFWFDYNVTVDENEKISKDIPITDISIRGRKHYWHHTDIENAITKEKTKRNCTITPVKVGTEFSFKVYFNDINKENLDELISVINLEYGTKNLSHKIGKGKPLGFGSCKIKAKNVYLREIYINEDKKLKYEMKKYNTENISLANFKNMESIPMQEALRIYDFDYIAKNYPEAKVQYPLGVKNGNSNSMLWFTINKSANKNNPYIIMVLPRIIDGKDDDGNEKFESTKIKVNGEEIGETHGLLLPKYKM